MPKRWKGTKNNPLMFQMEKAHLSKSDIVQVLRCELNTLNKHLDNPSLIPLGRIITLAGLFGMSTEELVYLLLRNKQQVSINCKWYIEEIRDKYKDDK